jgi:beta-glucanase (GH16 family)
MPFRKIIYSALVCLALFLMLSNCSKDNNNPSNPPGNPNPPTPQQLWQFESTPVWSEEFDSGTKPDPAKWTYETGGNGWGNNELEYYTNGDNVSIDNGILKIEARKESYFGSNYTSTRMITRNKADWLYGRFEIRAKLPKGRGTWPAIWMLPTDNAYGGWPNSGEIDIMEHVGFDPTKVYFTIHTQAYNHTLGTQKGANRTIGTALDSFHVYRLDWTSYGIRGFFDDEQVFEFLSHGGSSTWPFDQKFFMILNIAVGGSWGGAQGVDVTAFPTSMEIDYIKVYKNTK